MTRRRCFIEGGVSDNNVASADLSANGIGTEGITALCEALKCNDTLTMLSLASNSLGDDGATVLAEFLKTDQKITRRSTEAAPSAMRAPRRSRKRSRRIRPSHLSR